MQHNQPPMNASTISFLVKKQFLENGRAYWIASLVLFCFLSFLFLLIHQWQDSFAGAVQNGVFIIGLFLGGGVFTHTMLSELSSSPGSIWLLSLPAKHSEKTISAIIISTLFFLSAYLCIFYLASSIYLLYTSGFDIKYLLDLTKDGFYSFFFYYLILNGIILLGRVIFQRHSLIKTVLLGILLFVSINYINNGILTGMISDVDITSSIVFDSFQFVHLGENVKVYLPQSADHLSTIFVRLFLPISIWILVWLKLKEKQV